MKFVRKNKARVAAFKLVTLTFFGMLASISYAAQPNWWTTRGAVNSNTPNNSAAVNQGQLKWFTQKAVDELNDYPSVGAGSDLNNLVQGWQQEYQTGDYNATNRKPSDFNVIAAGQLKYIGSKVWSRLVTVGYTNAMPSWLAVQTTDTQVSNLGQLKTVFNFEISAPTGQVPAWWQTKYFTGIVTNVAPGDDYDGDGLTNLQEYQQGSNPKDYFSQGAITITPRVVVYDGGSAYVQDGHSATEPVVFKVVNSATGTALVNAPVTIAVSSGTGTLALSSTDSGLNQQIVRSDAQGLVKTFFVAPNP